MVSDNWSADEKNIAEKALIYAKKNKKPFAKQFTDTEKYPPENEPVSVFMAGSPGAGKTEASIELLKKFPEPILCIDPDELRKQFQDYKGSNAYLFQSAVSILVEKIIDLALSQQQSFILDGTLSNLNIARRNVRRSLGKKRAVSILFVYQDPRLAWQFVCKREQQEGRKIEKETFIYQYFESMSVVSKLREEFGASIHTEILLKNIDNSKKTYKTVTDKIDNHIPKKYTYTEIKELLTP